MSRHNFKGGLPWTVGLYVTLCAWPASVSAFPAYDHIVIVIEENHSASQIIGSANAPYINSLAERGLSLANFHAIMHPSQPNYLEFFSGANQGILNDTVPPAGAPYTTPNLGAELIAAGKTFAGYSEDLPSVGSTVGSSGTYRRRHNPWVNWQNSPQAANQLPTSVNQPFTAFPSNFTQLPYLSFVVPNLDNDMHNGTVAQGDAWLKTNLSAYADWAQTHNSLLIVTWDEDNSSSGNNNKIPTVMIGPNVSQGQNNATWTLHNLLRTMEDVAGTAHAGSAARVQPINGMFVTDPAAAKKNFQRGLKDYAGALDTHLRQDDPAASFGSVTPLVVDLDDNTAAGNQPVQALIKFDTLFGNGANQIPAANSIISAKLVIPTTTTAGDETTSTVELHRMKAAWSESSTWNSLVGGVSADDTEAVAAAEFTVMPKTAGDAAIFDVTGTLQAWLAGATNNGWVLLATGADGWRWNSSEDATVGLRPYLEVTYAYLTSWKMNANGNWSAAANWNPGVPNAVEATATFGSVATAPRTITLDAPMLVGKLAFDNVNSYTIAGASALSLQGGIGNASIYVAQGSHTIWAPLVLLTDANTTIAGGQLQISGGLTGNGHALNNNGPGTLVLGPAANVGNLDGLGNLNVTGSVTANRIRQNTLTISGSVTLNAAGADAATSRVNALVFSGSGKLNLNNNDLVVQSEAANRDAVLASLTSKAGTGFHGGLWDGPGLASSAAAGNPTHLTALGVIANRTTAGAPLYTTFSGQVVDANCILVRYTYYGDADLSGVVDGTDYALIDNGFNMALSGWRNGDFNYDGHVDGTDYALIDNAFNFQGGTLAALGVQSVPEPSAWCLLLIGLAILIGIGTPARGRASIPGAWR